MPDLLLRKIPRRLLDTLKAMARRNGRSLQQELHRILREGAELEKEDVYEGIRRVRERLAAKGIVVEDIVRSIREDRDR